MLKVFMSYASEDRAVVRPFFSKLKALGFDPWMDVESILPGQEWALEIEKAFLASHVYLLFMSPNSVNKRGFVQREARDALDRARESLEGDITVIPIRIAPCDVPSMIAGKVQYCDLDVAWPRVVESLKAAAQQRQVLLSVGVTHGPFQVFEESIDEEKKGRPGYDFRADFPRLTSQSLPAVAAELSGIFSGRAMEGLVDSRATMDEQFPDDYDGIGAEMSNSSTMTTSVAFASDEIVSFVTTHYGYFAGAAHGNIGFRCDTFVMSDGLRRVTMRAFFNDEEKALARLSALALDALAREYWSRTGKVAEESDLAWFREGAGPSWGNFDDGFTVNAEGIVLRFSPYQVHCYAMGTWTVTISFFDLLDVLSDRGFVRRLLEDRSARSQDETSGATYE